MVWSRRDKDNNIIYYTADGNSFDILHRAILHINGNLFKLQALTRFFQTNMDRRDKLENLIKKLQN